MTAIDLGQYKKKKDLPIIVHEQTSPSNNNSSSKKIKTLENKIAELTKAIDALQLVNTTELPGTMDMALEIKDYIFKKNIPSFNANDPKFRLGPIVYVIDIIKGLYKGKMI